MLWVVHSETVEYMKQHNPQKLRKYLIDMGDEETLRAHDAEMMKSKGKK